MAGGWRPGRRSGLADGVFSTDVERAKRVANQLRAGILYVNQSMTGVAAPGGGYKMSGIGREGGGWSRRSRG